MLFKNKKNEIDFSNVPKHVAFIMDGNGRWANKKGLPRTMGHKAGAETLFSIVDIAKHMGIKAITVYAFSTENWKRSKDEIDYIFKLLEKTLDEKKEELKRKDIQIRIMGDLNRLIGEYDSLKSKMEEIVEYSKSNNGIILNIAFNYGGKDEIINATKKIAMDVKNNNLSVDKINEELFESYLMTNGLPKIDLMIRTSGEKRISNFLLWQLAYSEMIFTSTYWPDFDEAELSKCIIEYQKRDRRFGNVK